LGLKGRVLGLQIPHMKPTHASRLINVSKTETLALDDVQCHDGDFMGLLGPMSMWKSKIPLGLGLPGCLQRQHPSFFLVKIFDVFLLLDGVTTSIYGI
jgi:hypothetical protein